MYRIIVTKAVEEVAELTYEILVDCKERTLSVVAMGKKLCDHKHCWERALRGTQVIQQLVGQPGQLLDLIPKVFFEYKKVMILEDSRQVGWVATAENFDAIIWQQMVAGSLPEARSRLMDARRHVEGLEKQLKEGRVSRGDEETSQMLAGYSVKELCHKSRCQLEKDEEALALLEQWLKEEDVELGTAQLIGLLAEDSVYDNESVVTLTVAAI